MKAVNPLKYLRISPSTFSIETHTCLLDTTPWTTEFRSKRARARRIRRPHPRSGGELVRGIPEDVINEMCTLAVGWSFDQRPRMSSGASVPSSGAGHVEGVGFPSRRESDLHIILDCRRAVDGLPLAIREVQERYKKIVNGSGLEQRVSRTLGKEWMKAMFVAIYMSNPVRSACLYEGMNSRAGVRASAGSAK